MKRWPIIRHIRAIRAAIAVNRHYRMWSALGYLPVHAHSDYEHIRRIWRGEAADEIERLQALIGGRDKFIVDQGLWTAFVDQLPQSKDEGRRDGVTAALVKATELNLPPDVQELLLFGDASRAVPAGILRAMLLAANTKSQIEERQRRDEVDAAGGSASLTQKAGEITFDIMSIGWRDESKPGEIIFFDEAVEPKLFAAISQALSESVQAERDRCTKIASDFMEFYRNEEFTDREKALRVGAAGNIVSAIQNPTE